MRAPRKVSGEELVKFLQKEAMKLDPSQYTKSNPWLKKDPRVNPGILH